MSDHILALLGVTGTLLFGIISIVLYYRSRHVRRLDALWSSATLQSRRHEDVSIRFRGQEIDDLSRLRVLLVNSGSEPVRPGSDFPAYSHGAVGIDKRDAATRFLSAACIAGDLKACSASASVDDDGKVLVQFEYMNPHQRVGVEVLYTGPTPAIHTDLIGGKVRLRRHSGSSLIDDLAEMLAFPIITMVGVILPATIFSIWYSRSGLPFKLLVAILSYVAFAAAAMLFSDRVLDPAWSRRRTATRQSLCLDFLAGASIAGLISSTANRDQEKGHEA
jgi:hypothetical protein